MQRRDTVVIGQVGPQVDSGRGPERWSYWRPTVAMCRHEDLLVDRLELLFDRHYRNLTHLLVEDIARISPHTEVRIHQVDYEDAWDFEEVFGKLHDFARGYDFDIEAEDYLLHMTTGSHVSQICLFLLAESRHFPARLLQTAPPPRHRRPDPGDWRIIDLDLSRYDRIASRFERERADAVSFLKAGITTRDEAFNEMIARIERVALASDAPILLTGPTGSGKTLLARRIYELRRRRRHLGGDLVEVNCSTLRGDQAMSALFGHRRGAYTGAHSDRPGLLRAADGGLLFLDEIGDLGVDEQAMLLRALESGTFLPVGADRETTSDFQLIAGTNRDLRAAVADGDFRDDLLARIDLWHFELPALRDRRADIEPNLDYELEEWTRRTGHRVSFNRQARRRYLDFATSPEATWAGNFRDLDASVTRMATLADGGRIDLRGVEDEIERLRRDWRETHDPSRDDHHDDEALLRPLLGDERYRQLDRFDRIQLADVVRVCRRSRTLSEAGRTLFAVSRQQKSSNNDADRPAKYLKKFGLTFSQIRDLE